MSVPDNRDYDNRDNRNDNPDTGGDLGDKFNRFKEKAKDKIEDIRDNFDRDDPDRTNRTNRDALDYERRDEYGERMADSTGRVDDTTGPASTAGRMGGTAGRVDDVTNYSGQPAGRATDTTNFPDNTAGDLDARYGRVGDVTDSRTDRVMTGRDEPVDRSEYRIEEDIARSGTRLDNVTTNRRDDYAGNITATTDPSGARTGASSFNPTGDRAVSGTGVLDRPDDRMEVDMDHDNRYDRDRMNRDPNRESIGDKVDDLKDRAEDKIEGWKDKHEDNKEERLRKERDKARSERDVQEERADLLKRDRDDY